MEKVQEKGLTKAIGISKFVSDFRIHRSFACADFLCLYSFSEAFIEDLLKTAKVPPAANQVSPSFTSLLLRFIHSSSYRTIVDRATPVPTSAQAHRISQVEEYRCSSLFSPRIDQLTSSHR